MFTYEAQTNALGLIEEARKLVKNAGLEDITEFKLISKLDAVFHDIQTLPAKFPEYQGRDRTI